jgi:hypothetical protein
MFAFIIVKILITSSFEINNGQTIAFIAIIPNLSSNWLNFNGQEVAELKNKIFI